MRLIISCFFCLAFAFGRAQSNYEQNLGNAAAALQQKDHCAALVHFQQAFEKLDSAGPYDLAYGAMAAAQCRQPSLALEWLKTAQRKGFGSQPGEVESIEKDSSFQTLWTHPEWKPLIISMYHANEKRKQDQNFKVIAWTTAIYDNTVFPLLGSKLKQAVPGFALYERKIGSLAVPYFVMVPKRYKPGQTLPLIVYLHGGVNSHEVFKTDDPGLATGEPIFAMADSLDAMVVYPMAIKTFGWLQHKAAFENVLQVVAEVQSRYRVNRRKIILAGMSNGGTATFWFAQQPTHPFAGFVSLSADTILAVGGPINVSNIGQAKPFVSIHVQDDDVFSLAALQALRNRVGSFAAGWWLQVLAKGGHGFLYTSSEGRELVFAALQQLLK